MAELIVAGLGVALLYAAVVRAGSSPVTWWLFRLRLTRVLTTGVALLLIVAALGRLAHGGGSG